MWIYALLLAFLQLCCFLLLTAVRTVRAVGPRRLLLLYRHTSKVRRHLTTAATTVEFGFYMAGYDTTAAFMIGCVCADNFKSLIQLIAVLAGLRFVVTCLTRGIRKHEFWVGKPDIWSTAIPHEDALGHSSLNQCTFTSSFCTTCEKQNWECLGKKESHHSYLKYVFVPTSCHRCAPDKMNPKNFRPCSVKAEQRKVYLSSSEYSRLVGALAHHRAVARRDAQTSFIGAMQTGGEMSNREDYLVQHIARMEALYNAPLLKTWWGWEQWPFIALMLYCVGLLPHGKAEDTQCAWASAWLRVDEVQTRDKLHEAPDPSVENSADDHGGKVPQLLATKLGDATKKGVKKLTGQDVKDIPDGAIDSEQMPGFMKPIGDATFVATFDNKAVKAGPIFTMPYVFHTQGYLNKILALYHRTQPEAECDIHSKMYLRYERFIKRCGENVFTDAAIDQALADMPPLEDLLRKKLSEGEVEALIENAFSKDSMNEKDWADFVRKFTVKLEGIIKHHKAPRGIQDEGFLRLLCNTMIGYIYEHVLFAACKNISIKGRDKCEVADAMVKEMSANAPGVRAAAGICGPGFIFIEIDQTKMESHVRMNKNKVGLMGPIRDLHVRIIKRIRHSFQPKLLELFHRLDLEDRRGMSMRVDGDDFNKTFVMKYEDYYMPSGWRFTSSANFLVELGVTLSAMCQDPERLWSKNGKGELHLQAGTHNFCFTDLVQDDKKKKSQVYIRPRVEGDDVGAHGSAKIKQREKMILDNFRIAGMSTKMELVEDGRGEFVGLHFPIVKGCINQSVPWVPAVARGLAKVGVITGAGEDPAAICYAKFLSLAMLYAGRVPPLAKGFYSLAMSWKEKLGDVEIKVDYDMRRNDKSVGEVGDILQKESYEEVVARRVEDMTDEGSVAKAIAMSCKSTCTPEEVNTFMLAMAGLRYDTCAIDIADMLPHCLRG